MKFGFAVLKFISAEQELKQKQPKPSRPGITRFISPVLLGAMGHRAGTQRVPSDRLEAGSIEDTLGDYKCCSVLLSFLPAA